MTSKSYWNQPARIYADDEWRTASMSGQCIQVLHDDDDRIRVRDSKNPTVEVKCSMGDWEVFIEGVKDGLFDF